MLFLNKKLFSLVITLVFSISVFSISASSAFAGSSSHNKKAVLDKDGDPILSKYSDNCVITKWEGSKGGCINIADIEGDATIYFDFADSHLNAQARKDLRKLEKKIGSSKNNVKHIHIVGYADRIGDAYYNKQLSEERAKSVQRYLKSKGISSKATHLEARGESKSYGCQGKDGAELISCLKKDRKVELLVEYK